MAQLDLEPFIRDVPDFPKPGILFKDITPLLAHPPAFHAAFDRFVDQYRGGAWDAVAAPEARGFLFAAPLALALGKPMIPLRKPGKLPYRTHSYAYELEYGSAELHVHTDAVSAGMRVLLIDDLLATGGTMAAAAELIRRTGGTVAGFAFLVELLFLKGREKLTGADVFSVIQY